MTKDQVKEIRCTSADLGKFPLQNEAHFPAAAGFTEIGIGSAAGTEVPSMRKILLVVASMVLALAAFPAMTGTAWSAAPSVGGRSLCGLTWGKSTYFVNGRFRITYKEYTWDGGEFTWRQTGDTIRVYRKGRLQRTDRLWGFSGITGKITTSGGQTFGVEFCK